MSGEMSGLDKRPVASVQTTDVGSFPCVDALVNGESTGMGEKLVALITDVGLDLGVGALVNRESTRLGKRPVASIVVTDVGPVPC
ncbi:hypothetical protein, partial [Sansalvadorimonas verongulae]|uniref:hypothetical protein n=1 Tax=Sansalvadorimonas verongulae TaxID=2172824 RepID=UPI001E31CD3B